MNKTINGKRLYDLIESSTALVVDYKGDGVIVSQLNFQTGDVRLTVSGVGYVDDIKFEFIFDIDPKQNHVINEVGQALIPQHDAIYSVSLLSWVTVTADQDIAPPRPEKMGYIEELCYLQQKHNGNSCTAEEKAEVLEWVVNTPLHPGNGTVALDARIQLTFPNEWHEGQNQIAQRDRSEDELA